MVGEIFPQELDEAPQIAVKIKAPKIGLVLVNKPNVIPASEHDSWCRQSYWNGEVP